MTDIVYTAKLEGSLRLSRDGEWFHNEMPFENKKLHDFFLKSVVWDEPAQQYFIEIGAQRATFTHEGYVYFAVSLDDSADPWSLSLSNGRTLALNPQTLASDKNGGIYCLDGNHKVLVLRAAYQILARHVISDTEIEILGVRYAI